ncbi:MULTISPECIES: hypothetical protein [unclassified Nostoc]|uniref:hypothetical protein n=1 Tax=unclassified Nostoc TaxID=2593658 RepID=UPI002AD29CB3|nr:MULTISPECIES: hypothetical protein [unclassified Nostoc]MDZ8126173.1 hypothetical protein [Nostoc sp. CmiVER01]MDZ8221795.1 hypothetical protein [Nostoc sp. ChiVER01]
MTFLNVHRDSNRNRNIHESQKKQVLQKSSRALNAGIENLTGEGSNILERSISEHSNGSENQVISPGDRESDSESDVFHDALETSDIASDHITSNDGEDSNILEQSVSEHSNSSENQVISPGDHESDSESDVFHDALETSNIASDRITSNGREGSNILERNISEHSNSSENQVISSGDRESDSESDVFHDALETSDIASDRITSNDGETEDECEISNAEASSNDTSDNIEISEIEIQQLIERFRESTHNKRGKFKITFKGKGRSKGRGSIFSTIDKLLNDFSKCSNQEEINRITDYIESLCDAWLKKHTYTIISNPSYKIISEYLEEFKTEINQLKDKPLPGFEENAELQNGKREKTQKKAEKLIDKYKNYTGTPSGFFTGVIPKVLDLMSPDTGDKSKFETQLRFPVHPGVFIGGRVTLSAERREDDDLKVIFEGTFQGGGTLGIAALGGEIGPYFECIAKDSASVGKLLNYGLYRRFRESRLMPRSITNTLWGESFGKSGYEKSEKMAAQIEQDVFGEKKDGKFTDPAKKSHIETGTTAAFISDFGVGGVGTGKAAAQVFEGRRVNQFSLDQTRGTRDDEESKNKQGTGVGKEEFEQKGRQRTKGQGSHRIQIANSGSFAGIGTYSIKLKLDLCSKPGSKWEEPKVNKWEIDLDGGARIPAYTFAQNPGLAALPIAVSAVEASRSMWAAYQRKYQNKAQFGGAAVNPMKDLTSQLYTAFTASAASYKVPALLGKDKTKFEGAIGLGVNFKCGQEAKPDEQVKDGKANLDPFKAELALQKTSYTGIKFLDSEVKLETAKRIAQWKWQEGKKAKLEFYPMTWEKEYNKDEDNPNTWGKFKKR